MTEQYIPLNEAMKLLGISKATMSNLVKAGDIAYITSKLDKRKKLVAMSEIERLKNPGSDEQREVPVHE